MYYRLTYLPPNRAMRSSGTTYFGANAPLTIGQQSSCDVRLPESSTYQPQLFAVILPYDDASGWYVVRRNDYFEITVDGCPLHTAMPLRDGSVLAFCNGTVITRIKFNIFNDGNYDPSSGIVYRNETLIRRTSVWLSVFFVLAAVALLALAMGGRRGIRQADLDPYAAALFRITVDSVFLTKDTVLQGRTDEVVLQAIGLDDPYVGTCFLTADGHYVTARHCIHPWIDDEPWDATALTSLSPVATRIAAQAETFNRKVGRQLYHVKTHCIVSNRLERHDYYSTDFVTDNHRDQVLPLGSDDSLFYWRTIIPLATRRDMELGDFAYTKVADSAISTLQMATLADLQQFNSQRDKDIVVLGFPVNDNDDKEMTIVFGNSQHFDYNGDGDTRKGCIMMNAPINPGNSGGPVLAYIGRKIMVVGIVSKADTRASQGTFWVVPASEVDLMKRQGETAVEDTLIFRR